MREAALRFTEDVLREIEAEADWTRAASLGELVARFLVGNYCGLYRWDALEQVLAAKFPRKVTPRPRRPKPELHIASELYVYGGHSRLLKTLVAEGDGSAEVLVTRPAPRDALLRITGVPDERLHVVQADDPVRQVQEIVDVASGFERIVLHIHPDDVVCAVALRLMTEAGAIPSIYFVNHSDHTFSVALALPQVVLEVSTFGWALREARGIMDKASFMGIPIRSRPDDDASAPRDGNRLFSAGAAYKFRPRDNASFPAVMSTLLGRLPTASLTVVGPTRRDHWWRPLQREFDGRVTLSHQLPHDEYLAQLATCGVYIDSYPVTGGTAFTEALLQGCPVAGLRGASFGYGAADGLRSTTEDGLIERVAGLMRGDEAEMSRQAAVRQAAREFHAPASVRQRLDDAMHRGRRHGPPPEFVEDVPYRSFEDHWGRTVRIVAPNFRTRDQARQLLFLLSRLSRAFGLAASSPAVLIAKAGLTAIRQRTPRSRNAS